MSIEILIYLNCFNVIFFVKCILFYVLCPITYLVESYWCFSLFNKDYNQRYSILISVLIV